MPVNDLFDEVEADTEAALALIDVSGAVEALENEWNLIASDADALILDPDNGLLTFGLPSIVMQTNLNFAAGGAIFDRITYEII